MIEQFLNEISLSNPLNLPDIDFGAGNEKPEQITIGEAEKDHRLTNYVRAQYHRFVGKVLFENYQHWLGTETGSFSGLVVSVIIR